MLRKAIHKQEFGGLFYGPVDDLRDVVGGRQGDGAGGIALPPPLLLPLGVFVVVEADADALVEVVIVLLLVVVVVVVVLLLLMPLVVVVCVVDILLLLLLLLFEVDEARLVVILLLAVVFVGNNAASPKCTRRPALSFSPLLPLLSASPWTAARAVPAFVVADKDVLFSIVLPLKRRPPPSPPIFLSPLLISALVVFVL